MKRAIYLLIIVATFASCATKMPKREVAYKNIYDEKPVSIIALPPINRSVKVEAKELFYSSLIMPLTQKGYYVLPPLLTMEILKEESAYDAELFMNNSMKRVGQLFGVDAVLFTVIHDWKKLTVLSQIQVKIEYILKSTKTDEILFNRVGTVTLNNSSSTGSFLGLVGGMIATALTREIEVGRVCNIYTLSDLPEGKYSPDYLKDREVDANPREFRVTY